MFIASARQGNWLVPNVSRILHISCLTHRILRRAVHGCCQKVCHRTFINAHIAMQIGKTGKNEKLLYEPVRGAFFFGLAYSQPLREALRDALRCHTLGSAAITARGANASYLTSVHEETKHIYYHFIAFCILIALILYDNTK